MSERAIEYDINKNGQQVISAQRRGETVAYALQTMVGNLAGNFFEPYVNHRIQKYYVGKHGGNAKGYGSYTQNLAGELAGDIIDGSTLILAETLCPVALRQCTGVFKQCIDPLYTKAAKMAFAKDKDSPDYEQKMTQWKTYQERNLARSAIMVGAGIIGNIATQKLVVGNPAPARLILAGKMVSTSLVATLNLGLRLAMPDKTMQFDNWLGGKIAPMLSDVPLIGVATKPRSHVAQLASQKAEQSLQPAL